MKIYHLFFFGLLGGLALSAKGEITQEFPMENIQFVSHGVTLSGTLVFPKTESIQAVVVFVHGSGKQTRSLYWAKRFAESGIATLVYDKRGVGQSSGEYESKQNVGEENISLLADDSLAAFSLLQNHSKTKQHKMGLAGVSQAGLIVPLAAQKNSTVDFMVLWSGPVCKVSEEDIFSKYTADLDSQKVPSYQQALKARKYPYIWPKFLGKDTDPSESLAKLKIPGLWIFGEKDGSVPVDLSIQRLKKLIETGGQYSYVLFSDLGHNNMHESFSTATDWIKRLTNIN